MTRNPQCRMMSLLIGIFLMSIIISNYNVQATRRSKSENDYASVKRLYQILRQLEENDNEQLSFEARTEAQGGCTNDILEGYQWKGVEITNTPWIDTTQRCLDYCALEGKCMGWSYKPSTSMCFGFSVITGIMKVSDVNSGSCVGSSIKTKCTNQQPGEYTGTVERRVHDITTVGDCMTSCDRLDICVGWGYSSEAEQCFLYSDIGQFESSNDFISGACLARENRFLWPISLNSFRNQALRRHNDKRKMHCISALTMDDHLNKRSQDLADKLATVDKLPPKYEPNGLQNVYFDEAMYALPGSFPVDYFYGEGKYYNSTDPNLELTKHYVKIIWKSSTKMGVGRAFASDNITMYIVISYDWNGDITESYKDNVLDKCPTPKLVSTSLLGSNSTTNSTTISSIGKASFSCINHYASWLLIIFCSFIILINE